ncbi:MAG TPA: DUF2332 domain-containing protein [Roseiflexaceae bacterium]|nr:DUF2332 domain-containing protein [Roseiflexaceae bacterium]
MTHSIETLAQRFRRFGERECVPSSPLYGRLAVGISEDPALLELATAAEAGPVPNLFLAAVQYMLLHGATHPLAAFYHLPGRAASLTVGDADPFPAFRAFCLEQATAMRALLASRRVQTNEVRRCACLMPAFLTAARRAGRRPLALVEVGASAGFNLLWDSYGYEYGAGGRYGDLASPVQLRCELRGGQLPAPVPFPQIAYRVGLDLNPIDARDDDAMLWLRALIWPEQRDRAALLEQAIAVAQQNPPRLLAGDALDLLPGAIGAAPEETLVCVFHTFTLNQFPQPARERFDALIAEQAARRDLCVIAIEWREPYPAIDLTWFASDERQTQRLGFCDAHGAWIEWNKGGLGSC